MNQSQKLEAAFRALHDMEHAEGSNAKKAILEANQDNDILRDLAFACYGGDKFNAYPSIKFDDTDRWVWQDDVQALQNYKNFRELLVNLRDRNVTGNDAIAAIDGFFKKCMSTEKKWYRRVLEHDLKVGLASSFSKVWDFKTLTLEGTARAESEIVFPGVMRCEKDEKHVKKWDAKDGILVEPKMDGLRLLFVWAGGDRWSFFSRGGKAEAYNRNLKHIAEQLLIGLKAKGYKSGSIDGEIMGEKWNDTLSIKRKTVDAEDQKEIDRVNFHVFDHLMSTNGRDDRTQTQRRTTLEEVFLAIEAAHEEHNVILVVQHLVDTIEEARPHFHRYVTSGYEGVILKCPKATYNGERNKASKQWVKMKPIDTQDVRVTGWYGGRERTRLEGNFGGFEVTNQDGQDFKVGGGFSDAQRSEIMADINAGRFDKKYKGRWLEIEYQRDQVAKGRFPVFIRWRDDVDVAD